MKSMSNLFSNACIANFASNDPNGLRNAERLARCLKDRHGHDAEFWLAPESGCYSVRATAKAVPGREAVAPTLETLREFAAGFYAALKD